MKGLAITYRLAWLLLLSCMLSAQPISFHHLTRSDGLSDNSVKAVVVDKTGFLWIGTNDGLNVYDGYSITSFNREKEPHLSSNNIIHLTADSRNRIWAGSYEGANWIDDRRRFHRILLNDSISRFHCATILETRSHGIILYTDRGQFFNNNGKWQELPWTPPQLEFSRFFDAENFDEDKIIYATDSLVILADYATRRVVFEYPVSHAVSACRTSNNEIAIGIMNGRVITVDTRTHAITHEYRLTNELNGRTINTNLSEVRRAANGDLIVATDFAGLITIDQRGTITRHTHDPLNQSSISSNNTYRAFAGANGEIVVGTGLAGVNMGNIYNKQAGSVRVFSDAKGNLFDNFVSDMLVDRAGQIWIGASDRLINWDKRSNRSVYYHYYFDHHSQGLKSLHIRALCMDKLGRIWVSAQDGGIALFNRGTGAFTRLRISDDMGDEMQGTNINQLLLTADGSIWASSGAGMFRFDPVTAKPISFRDHPVLKAIYRQRITALFEDHLKRIWIGTQNAGIYRFDPATQELRLFTKADGLAGNATLAFGEDSSGNIYAGTIPGFSIIQNSGSIKAYTTASGLRYDRCESFLFDDAGSMWIANSKCIIRFNPQSGRMQIFDENAGLSNEGFRSTCAVKAQDGTLIWGSMRGINYFQPSQLVNNPSQIKVNIFSAQVQDSVIRFQIDHALSIPWSDNTVIFHFTAINLQGSTNVLYEYMLEGYDRQWQRGTDIRQVRYAALPAGHYVFKVRASSDHQNWVGASNTVAVDVVPPLWQRWWFILGVTALLALAASLFLNSRTRKLQRQREELETEQAINYFASSMSYQPNVDLILWDVVKNCIGKLQFEDCVIYLLDTKRNVLIQKAAHGPKNPRQFEIEQPIEIEVGKGIVGSVAASGQPEMIADTRTDPRYIVDDEQRLSEISVPIVSEGRVLGVIDCEHSRKNFFTHRHLSILTTIASLVANKIVRARAEEEKARAERILTDTRQKMAEAEMQALRAQMNPHFIFNCLNSINRYIVKSDQATASLYLTRFAKLIRLILDNSNSKNVILSNELEALKLYIEMEALRFDKKFSYSIRVDNNVNTDSVEVPPLIMQPYVENAIWHGLLHKEHGGRLDIQVSMAGDSMLRCVIEDDGVGRLKAQELKSKSAVTRKSLGMKLTEGRISLLNRHAELNASVDIIDITTPGGEAGGTKVILMIPC